MEQTLSTAKRDILHMEKTSYKWHALHLLYNEGTVLKDNSEIQAYYTCMGVEKSNWLRSSVKLLPIKYCDDRYGK